MGYLIAMFGEKKAIYWVFALGVILSAVLVLIMQLKTPYNVHPDEYSHVAAARYYLNHWVPPKLDDPGVRATRSMYGFSYLDLYI